MADVAHCGFVGVERLHALARLAGLVHFFSAEVLYPGDGVQLAHVIDVGQFPGEGVGKIVAGFHAADVGA